MKLSRQHFTLGLLAIVAVLAISATLGHPMLPPDVLLGIGLVPFALGEISDPEIKQMLNAQASAFEQFKTTNDARMAALAKGESVSDLDAKLAKLNGEFTALQKRADEIEKKSNRPALEHADVTPEQAEYRKAFSHYLRTGEGDSRQLKEMGRKAMNTGSDPDGGYLVLPEMDLAIERVAETMGGLAQLADTVTIGSAKWSKMMKTSGLAMRRVADGSAGGETTNPQYAKVEIEAHTAEVEPWVYNETLEDAIVDLESDLAMEAAIGFNEGANAEFITGNGVGKSRGITAYTNVHNSSYAWGSVGFIRSGKSAAFMSVAPADRVISLQHALKAQYRAGAHWLTNDTTLGIMRQLKDGSNAYYLWQPDPSAGFGGRFLGSPVTVDDNMPALGAATHSLAYGNFKRAYKIVQRAGTTLIRDNITSKGQTKFNFRRRFGGGIYNFEAIKLMQFATGAA